MTCSTALIDNWPRCRRKANSSEIDLIATIGPYWFSNESYSSVHWLSRQYTVTWRKKYSITLGSIGLLTRYESRTIANDNWLNFVDSKLDRTREKKTTLEEPRTRLRIPHTQWPMNVIDGGQKMDVLTLSSCFEDILDIDITKIHSINIIDQQIDMDFWMRMIRSEIAHQSRGDRRLLFSSTRLMNACIHSSLLFEALILISGLEQSVCRT